jgi:DNA-binding NtrC family response regulator
LFTVLTIESDCVMGKKIEIEFAGKVSVKSIKSIDYILDLFAEDSYDLLVWDTAIAKKNKDNGIELLEVISSDSPQTQVLIIAVEEDTGLAIESIAAGAYQYLISPVKDSELFPLIRLSMENQPQIGHNLLLNTGNLTHFYNIKGISPQIREVFKQINYVAQTDISVLITGETGTGKDLVAEAMHLSSQRSKMPFITVNTGAMAPELISSTLFGHVKGAFTGALEDKAGRFEEADQGTLFLDEIGTMDDKTQISLLRILENQSFLRTGGKKNIHVDVRVIAATNENLLKAVEDKTFREDLFYRFDVFRINIPPLRKRFGDIAYLANYFTGLFAKKYKKPILEIDEDAMKLMEVYSWPGNVRELKNSLQRAVLLCQNEILTSDLLPARICHEGNKMTGSLRPGLTLSEVENKYISLCLKAEPNKSELARMLGISRKALYAKIKKYNIKS